MKLTQADFKQRRDLLAKQIGSNSIAIIATRAEMYRNRDADYKYRADSSFYYLTGFAEPEAVAVIETFAEGEDYSYSLFCRERDREMEIWNGYRAGVDGAIDVYDADEAYAIESAAFAATIIFFEFKSSLKSLVVFNEPIIFSISS